MSQMIKRTTTIPSLERSSYLYVHAWLLYISPQDWSRKGQTAVQNRLRSDSYFQARNPPDVNL
jgi:hypothetical protein